METSARVHSRDGSSPPSSTTDALLWASLSHLHLNIAQTASLCGISVRQLGYWTKQGYVTAEGVGERRMYGLDALRRILSIRRLMAEGTSLRQALRALPKGEAASGEPGDTTEQSATALSYKDAEPERETALAPKDADALAAALKALFDKNRHVRDSADGLAVKLGWPSAHVRRVAEALCAQGVLGQTRVQNEAVFQRREEPLR